MNHPYKISLNKMHQQFTNNIGQKQEKTKNQQFSQIYKYQISQENSNVHCHTFSHSPKKRKKIFQKIQFNKKVENYQQNRPFQRTNTQKIQVTKEQNNFRKKPNQKTNVDHQIEEINQKIQTHRQNIASGRLPKTLTHAKSLQNMLQFQKIQQKLQQSKQILKRQESVITNRLSSFQRNIETNKTAIDDIKTMIANRFHQQQKKLSSLMHVIESKEEFLKSKEMNIQESEKNVLRKERQVNKNEYESKQKAIELQRIKRLKSLELKNLQIYQEIQKNNTFDRFSTYVRSQVNENNNNSCWGEDDQPSIHLQSKIKQSRYKEEPILLRVNQQNHIKIDQWTQNKIISSENKYQIEQLLSPLSFNENINKN